MSTPSPQKPSFFFEAFGREPHPASAKAKLEPTMWMVRNMAGITLGIVEKAGPRRFSAHRGAKMIGAYETQHAAGAALLKAHDAAQAAKDGHAPKIEEARV